MSYFHIGVILATAAILQVSTYPVVVFPEYFITDVGTESVTTTCTVSLDQVSKPYSEYSIRWAHGRTLGTKIVANNGTVVNQNKYSLHEMSSIASDATITQSLTVHGIEEDDTGGYWCNPVFFSNDSVPFGRSAIFKMVVRNVIPLISCDYKPWSRELTCFCHPGDPPLTLQWFDKDGNVLGEGTQSGYTNYVSVEHAVPTESSIGEQFTCVATSPGTVTTQECIGTQIMPTADTIEFSFIYHQSTMDGLPATEVVPMISNFNDASGNSYVTSPSTTHVGYNQNIQTEFFSTPSSNDESGNSYLSTSPTLPYSIQNITTYTFGATNAGNVHTLTPNQIYLSKDLIIVISVIGMMIIVMNMALMYIIIRKNKHTCDTGMSMEPYRQQHGDSTHQHQAAPSEDIDGYFSYIPSHHDQLGASGAPSQDKDGYINYNPHYDECV
ncbi:uncharacterized protein LOC117104720 [Anneissia japonica]|uniref:uncharacterized protein LOC117104720 n=1 Tax=Anneissia japonica TaxID=1529436 RepID=UPI001425B9A7|nr:uncharacterized protein LOC117104720 [Anneissia japonica]